MTTANIKASPAGTKASPGPVYFWGILLFSAFTLLVIAWFKFLGPQETYEDKRAALRTSKLQALRQEDQKNLTGYSWVNKPKGVARIPIDRAMELVASDLKDATVSPSTVKVENPYPAGLPTQPAPAPEAKK